MKRINTELTFERVIKFLQCQGVVFEDGMYNKKHGVITYGYDFYTDGNFIHCFSIHFPEGGYKKGTQRIIFGEIFENSEGWHQIASVVCEDIMAFVREFEYAEMWHPRTMKTTDDWSYLYDIEYLLIMPNAESNDDENSEEEEVVEDEQEELQDVFYDVPITIGNLACNPWEEIDEEIETE